MLHELDLSRDISYSHKEVKELAQSGIIWRDAFLWNGRIRKTLDYSAYCKCGRRIHFNQWTPSYNICLRCRCGVDMPLFDRDLCFAI